MVQQYNSEVIMPLLEFSRVLVPFGNGTDEYPPGNHHNLINRTYHDSCKYL
jgi:hypothetical protein